MSEELERKKKQFQENVNRKALIDWILITGLRNPRRKKIGKLLEDLSTDILRYPTSKGNPFSWPAPAGISGGVLAIRIFMSEGRKTLYDYNSKNGTEIKLSRERTLSLEDQDRLGLFIRKAIKDAYNRANKRSVEVTLKKSLLKIGDHEPVKPAIAAVLLNLDLSSWTGLPIDELLTDQEKTKLQTGEIKRGSLKLPDIQLPLLEEFEEMDVEKENGVDASETNVEEIPSTSQLKKQVYRHIYRYTDLYQLLTRGGVYRRHIVPYPMERMLRDIITSCLNKSGIVPEEQHGFLQGEITVSNLADSLFDWTVAPNNNQAVDNIMSIFQKLLIECVTENLS